MRRYCKPTGHADSPPPSFSTSNRDNLSLDKALHTMLMTNILPNAAQHSRSVDKRNAMSGRVLEVSSGRRESIWIFSLGPLGQKKMLILPLESSSADRFDGRNR